MRLTEGDSLRTLLPFVQKVLAGVPMPGTCLQATVINQTYLKTERIKGKENISWLVFKSTPNLALGLSLGLWSTCKNITIFKIVENIILLRSLV